MVGGPPHGSFKPTVVLLKGLSVETTLRSLLFSSDKTIITQLAKYLQAIILRCRVKLNTSLGKPFTEARGIYCRRGETSTLYTAVENDTKPDI